MTKFQKKNKENKNIPYLESEMNKKIYFNPVNYLK